MVCKYPFNAAGTIHVAKTTVAFSAINSSCRGFDGAVKHKKNCQFMTACSLLRLLLLKIPYLTTLGPKMELSNISVKYSEEIFVSGVSKIGEYRIEICRVRCGLGFYCYTHSLTYSEGQHSRLHLRGSKLQKGQKCLIRRKRRDNKKRQIFS